MSPNGSVTKANFMDYFYKVILLTYPDVAPFPPPRSGSCGFSTGMAPGSLGQTCKL